MTCEDELTDRPDEILNFMLAGSATHDAPGPLGKPSTTPTRSSWRRVGTTTRLNAPLALVREPAQRTGQHQQTSPPTSGLLEKDSAPW